MEVGAATGETMDSDTLSVPCAMCGSLLQVKLPPIPPECTIGDITVYCEQCVKAMSRLNTQDIYNAAMKDIERDDR